MWTTIIATSIGAAIALVGTIIGLRYQARTALRERRLERLGPQWAKLIQVLQSQKVSAKEMQEFRRELALWGSAEAVDAYDAWSLSVEALQAKRNESPQDALQEHVRTATCQLIRTARRELGQDDHPSDIAIWRLFVNN